MDCNAWSKKNGPSKDCCPDLWWPEQVSHDNRRSDTLFDLEHLTALIHAGLEVHVMWAMQFAGHLVLDEGITLNGVMSPAHAAL